MLRHFLFLSSEDKSLNARYPCVHLCIVADWFQDVCLRSGGLELYEFPESFASVGSSTVSNISTTSEVDLMSDQYVAERAQLRILDTDAEETAMKLCGGPHAPSSVGFAWLSKALCQSMVPAGRSMRRRIWLLLMRSQRWQRRSTLVYRSRSAKLKGFSYFILDIIKDRHRQSRDTSQKCDSFAQGVWMVSSIEGWEA